VAKFQIREIPHLAIIGMGKSVYQWIVSNYADIQDCEVWTLNMGSAIFRHDVVFDMHEDEYLVGDKAAPRIDKRREWLKKHDKPIIMPKALSDFPTSLTYPLREVIEGTGSTYFSTGVAYMLALAYMCKVRQLKLFGIDFSYDRSLATHNEPGQKCCEYWTGRIQERGCNVELPNDTHFMDMHHRTTKATIYGYAKPLEFDYPIVNGKPQGQGKFIGPDYAD